MTTVLTWLTKLGFYVLLGLLFAVAAQFAGNFGPKLDTPALLVGLGIVTLFVSGFYYAVKDRPVASWRCFYGIPVLLIGFGAYCNTGYVWMEDHALAREEPLQRLEALRDYPAPGPSEKWILRVNRDVKIANAREEYDAAMSRIQGSRTTPFPSGYTPVLYVAALIFAVIALLPSHRITAVLARI
jgi:hypothetical protein